MALTTSLYTVFSVCASNTSIETFPCPLKYLSKINATSMMLVCLCAKVSIISDSIAYFGCRSAYSLATLSMQGQSFFGSRSWWPTMQALG